MKIEFPEEYEDLATEWQYQMIIALKKSLKDKGIVDEKAKGIIGDFIFDFSMLHDQGEIKLEGKSYNPRISFDDFNGSLITSNEESNLHDYAFGSTSEAFGE